MKLKFWQQAILFVIYFFVGILFSIFVLTVIHKL